MNAKHHSWVDMAVFENVDDGHALETFFKNHRLDARTYDDKWFRYFLFLRPPHMTYRVQVRANTFPAATELLEREAPAVLEKALHCPSCRSLQVNYPQMTRKFITPTVILHLGIIFRVIDHTCYCEHCHEMWDLSKKTVVRKEHTAEPFPM